MKKILIAGLIVLFSIPLSNIAQEYGDLLSLLVSEEYEKVIALKSRATYREHLNPLSKKKDVGFRCAKDKLTLYEKFFGKTFPKKV